jgi:hypothetical protein
METSLYAARKKSFDIGLCTRNVFADTELPTEAKEDAMIGLRRSIIGFLSVTRRSGGKQP